MRTFYRILVKDLEVENPKTGKVEVFAKEGEKILTSIGDPSNNTVTVLDDDCIIKEVSLDYFDPVEVTDNRFFYSSVGTIPTVEKKKDLNKIPEFRIVSCKQPILNHGTPLLFYIQYKMYGEDEWRWLYENKIDCSIHKGTKKLLIKKFFINRSMAEDWILKQFMADEISMDYKELEESCKYSEED